MILNNESETAFRELLEVLEDPFCTLDDHAQRMNESFVDATLLHVKEDSASPPRIENMQYTQRRMHAIFNSLKNILEVQSITEDN